MFQDTIPDGLRDALPHPPSRMRPAPLSTSGAGAGSASFAAGPALPHRLAIRFTGSGSEYFRIWIVNLLLTVVTLGLYLPWAKVRRLQYFHGNTLVDDEPLGFHGNPRKMLRGYLLVGLMFTAYTLAGQMSPIAGLVALVVVSVLSPALLRASLQFRLANTSWRGLRMRFEGSLREVYVLLWPSLGVIALGVVMGFVIGVQGAETPAQAGTWPLLFLLPVYAALIWMFWRLKKYQHDHYGWASLSTRFTPGPRSFFGLALRGAGVLLLAFVVAIVLTVAMATVFGQMRSGGSRWGAAAMSVLPLAAVVVFFVSLKPWFTTRLQNLVWCGTTGHGLQFSSALRFRPMAWLTLRNWLLILLTLGLYWPFAAIAMARMRLQAVAVSLAEHPATLVGRARAGSDDAAGDAAGDLFGIDIGF